VGLNNAKAVLEAIWGAIRNKPCEFVRTPKYGMTGKQKQWKAARVFTLKRIWLPILELVMGAYMAMCVWISIWYGFGYTSVPFLLIFTTGYLYVGFSSLHALWKMHLEAQQGLDDVLPIEPTPEPVL
jgi:hypothetical protein